MGFTLIEILLAVGLLIAGVCVILFGMHFSMIHSEYLAQVQVARSAAQGLLDRLSTAKFATLERCPTPTPPPPYQCTEELGGQTRRCALEDANCDGTVDPVTEAPNFTWLNNALPNGALIVQIRPPGGLPTDYELLDVHVAVCWEHRGRPISEDTDCNGIQDENSNGALEDVEDPNRNGWIDSPAMVSTRIGSKED